MAARGNRDDIVLATKVGRLPGAADLSPSTIRRAAEDSLKRLQTDRIDLYYAHGDDDESLPVAGTLAAFGELIREGKVRHIAASNYGAPRLAEALALAQAGDLPSYIALQPHYNLMHREEYEGALAELCAREGLSCVPYFALASGFLTGKYRVGSADTGSPRAGTARGYLDDRGLAVLAVLDELAASHDTTVAAVALSWLAAQPTVAAPIASARTPEQLADLLPLADLELGDAELQRLTSAAST
jgi:aryl-alcohol dehydrogenase-like predicted oxidoreductase